MGRVNKSCRKPPCLAWRESKRRTTALDSRLGPLGCTLGADGAVVSGVQAFHLPLLGLPCSHAPARQVGGGGRVPGEGGKTAPRRRTMSGAARSLWWMKPPGCGTASPRDVIDVVSRRPSALRGAAPGGHGALGGGLRGRGGDAARDPSTRQVYWRGTGHMEVSLGAWGDPWSR